MKDFSGVNSVSAAQNGDQEIDFQLYRYVPSLPAAIVSVIVFGILTGLHVWRLYRARAFYFTAFTVGGLCKDQLGVVRLDTLNVVADQYSWFFMIS